MRARACAPPPLNSKSIDRGGEAMVTAKMKRGQWTVRATTRRKEGGACHDPDAQAMCTCVARGRWHYDVMLILAPQWGGNRGRRNVSVRATHV
mmetsp:Transcript_55388/g.166037  ORF Transcript_55388/g.166037 Transcript_55388/m.166037 type:complete len:93 (+) Transcript_55388:2143-2421(+)